MADMHVIVSGILLDEDTYFTLPELCSSCGVHAEELLAMVDDGILNPTGDSLPDWRFSCVDLIRAHRALRLQRDLELNLPGVALALQLLEEVERLRARVRVLESTQEGS